MAGTERSPSIVAAERFTKHLDQASGPLQLAAYREVQELVRAYRELPKTFLSLYGRPSISSRQSVLEMRLSRGDRALVHWEHGTFALLDMGDHEIVPGYRREWLRRDTDRSGTR